MRVNDKERVQHILDTARTAISLVEGKVKNDLFNDEKLKMAVLYTLLIIGEAASGISNAFKEQHTFVPWKKIVGMRNRLIHGYFEVDLDIVWEAVSRNVPILIEQLEKIENNNL